MRRRLFPILLPLLLLTFGFTEGKQMDEQAVIEKADSVAKLDPILAHPTVETSADYDPISDEWRVLLIEEASDTTVAWTTVADDSGEVVHVRLSPISNTLDYPTLSEDEAIRLATANPRVRDTLAEHSGYTTDSEYEDEEWTVHFRVRESGAAGGVVSDDSRKEVARVGIEDDSWVLDYVYTGDQVGWNMARGVSGSYGKQANYWYVWGPLALAFAFAFFRADKLLSLRNLDVLALLGFLVSHGFFRQGISYEAVLLWYPPLIYLLARTLLMGFGVGERVEKTSNLPAPALFALAAAASILVLGLNLDSRVIDVGYAGVVGADRILDGILPYGNMPSNVGTGDTYGPLNYVFYVPFVAIFGFSGEWDFLPAAHAATAFAFVGGALAMLFAGWKLGGLRAAAALVFAWAVFPYTLYSTNNNTNDIIVAAVAAVGLAAASSPIARGAAVAAGFAVKLYPLLLAPLWMFHDGRRRAPIIDFVLGGVGVVVASFWVLLLDGHPVDAAKLFYDKTFAFQGVRESPWTIFTQIPELSFLQTPMKVATILLAVVVAFVPRKRTVRRLAALSAAVVISLQLTTNYWFYPYITWFEPFVFLALLPATNTKTPLDGSNRPSEEAGDRQPDEHYKQETANSS